LNRKKVLATGTATSAVTAATSSVPQHLSPVKVTEVYDSYWKFAAERQNVFFKRLAGAPEPWTNDPVIAAHKFTNAYRASDRVSQYLIRNVIYRDDLPSQPEEVTFRILLFKFFNKIETWELLEHSFGAVTLSGYVFDQYDKVLADAMRAGGRIYSAAYIMPPGGTAFGFQSKHQNHLKLLERMMADGLAHQLRSMKRMQDAFDLLRSYPTIGDFLAYQFVTDINYSEVTNFSESEFVVPGPGARDGLRKCFADTAGLNEAELIRLMMDSQEREFARLGLRFMSLWSRRLQLIDCQNLFCEVDKFARVAHPDIAGISGRVRIKQKFAQTGPLPSPWYPPKWGVNDHVKADVCNVVKNEAGDRAGMGSQRKLMLGKTYGSRSVSVGSSKDR
jgi:hypothetical protein